MDLDAENLGGELVLGMGVVNSGKTEDLIETIGKLLHSGYKDEFMVFTNSRNTRDGTRRIVSTSGLRFENIYVADAENPANVHEIIARRDVGRKSRVIIFDEVNLHTHRFVPVVKRLMSEGRVVVVYGLNLDFRGETFGPMGRLVEIARARETIIGKELVFMHKPYCKVAKDDGNQCERLAGYSLRIVKMRDTENETRYLDIDGEMVRGFTKAPYYGPTIIVGGSKKSTDYTTACADCFGEVPGRKLVEDLLAFVQQGGKNGRSYEEIMGNFAAPELPEVIAYAVEERKLDISGGQYTANTICSHPTWKEAEGLAVLGEEIGVRAAMDVYRLIKESSFIQREAVRERFRDMPGLERILSGLITVKFITFNQARLSMTHYVRDTASGMYVPFDSI